MQARQSARVALAAPRCRARVRGRGEPPLGGVPPAARPAPHGERSAACCPRAGADDQPECRHAARAAAAAAATPAATTTPERSARRAAQYGEGRSGWVRRSEAISIVRYRTSYLVQPVPFTFARGDVCSVASYSASYRQCSFTILRSDSINPSCSRSLSVSVASWITIFFVLEFALSALLLERQDILGSVPVSGTARRATGM